MTSTPLLVIAHWRTTPESVDRVRDVGARQAAASETEPGCRRFTIHQDAEDPTRFVLVEEYDDEAAFAAHRETEHFRTLVEGELAPLLVEREWRRYGPGLAASEAGPVG